MDARLPAAPLTPGRLFLHVDLDAFFASVEQCRNPHLRGRPVVVGSGVIASCSYEARAHGLQNGMPLFQARRLCRDIVVVEGRHEIYRCFVESLWEICRRHLPVLETFLDEANADLTGTRRIHPDPLGLGARIRKEIKEETGRTATVGLARNRMLAKMAAKSVKPDGLARLLPGEEDAYLADLPVADLPGIGHKRARMLGDMNIRTVREFRAIPLSTLEAIFGSAGRLLHERARGEDTRPLIPHEIPKSVSRETTFHRPVNRRAEVRAMLYYLLERAMHFLRKNDLRAERIRLRLRAEDFRQQEASRSLPGGSAVDEDFHPSIDDMLDRLFSRRVSLRLVGVILSGLLPGADPAQQLLFEQKHDRSRRIHDAVDRIRSRWGHGAIRTGRALALTAGLDHDRHGYILRTPCLTK